MRPDVPADLVYFVKRGEVNDELRFSLRSVAANLPHERVWIVGDAPSWVVGCEVVPGNRKSTKWENGPDNLRVACEEVPADWVVVMNDDFFVTRPVERLVPRVRERKLIDQVARVRPGPWRDSLAQTAKLLGDLGVPDPRSYEFHVPVPMRLDHLHEAVSLILYDRPRRQPAQWRTVYGNLFAEEDWPDAELARDYKARSRMHAENESGFESSDDHTFARVVRPSVAAMFPERCRYEAEDYARQRREKARRAAGARR